MSRRRKDPFSEKENVRHFRLMHRPAQVGSEDLSAAGTGILSFDEMFEEYDPSGAKNFRETEELEIEDHFDENGYEYDFANDDDGELVDIDAELDQFAEDFIDIIGDDKLEQVRPASLDEKVGESAKYGILFDDRGYDYTKHLRRVGVTPGAVYIQAPGQKKETSNSLKNREFFSGDVQENEESSQNVSEDVFKANHEEARQQYLTLLNQVSDNPMLREVIEALEDERYETGDFDDELVISLDNLNISNEDEDDLFDENEDINILDDDEEFPDFVPSEALRRQMERISAKETEFLENETDEFDAILDEYDEEYDEKSENLNMINNRNEIVDIEGESECEIDPIEAEKAAAIYDYLREHGRARGTTLYDKKRASHLPPIHVAIAQYSELRRELSVNNELIIQKYSQEDEEEYERQIKESEKIIEGMVKSVDKEDEQMKRLNIETSKHYALNTVDSTLNRRAGPKKIIEISKKSSKTIKKENQQAQEEESSESESEHEEEERVNKGIARSTDESAEEKRSRKAKIKADKREKRIEKKNRK